MRPSRSLPILWTLSGALALSGCHSFTLVGSVNLGGGESPAVGSIDDHAVDNPDAAVTCIPKRPSAVTAEFSAHGFTVGNPDWQNTRKWFAAIGKIPTCP